MTSVRAGAHCLQLDSSGRVFLSRILKRIVFQICRLLFLIIACTLRPGVASAAPSVVTLDVLVLYDKTAVEYFKSEVATAMYSWANQMNVVNVNSSADIRWRIVGVVANDVSSVATSEEALGKIRLDNNVTNLKNSTGADFVVQLTKKNDVCGIGYVSTSSNTAYSIVSPDCGPLVMAHELGHNLGLSHSRADGSVSGSRYRYGLGYVVPNKFGDIMSYSGNHNAKGIAKYSNPRQTQDGEPFGVAVGLPAEADAVQAINNAKEVLYSFAASKYSGCDCVYTWGQTTWNQDGQYKATAGDVFKFTGFRTPSDEFYIAKKTGTYTLTPPLDHTENDQWKYAGAYYNGRIFIKLWGDGDRKGTAGEVFLIPGSKNQHYALKTTGYYYSTPFPEGTDNNEWRYVGTDYDGANFLKYWSASNQTATENDLFAYDNPYSSRREYFRAKHSGSYGYFPIDAKDNGDWQFVGITRSTCLAGTPC